MDTGVRDRALADDHCADRRIAANAAAAGSPSHAGPVFRAASAPPLRYSAALSTAGNKRLETDTLTLEQAVRARHSVRGFLDTPVPQSVLEEIFELARWSPSGTNIQPWQVLVASGPLRDHLRAEMLRRIRDGEPQNPDHPDKGRLGEPYRSRRRDCARVLYDAMGIEWEDKAGRSRAALRNFEMFDAPHVAFVCMDSSMGISAAVDVGMYAQTLMLAMSARGLGSCAQGTMRHYPDVVREAFGVGPEVSILFGISFGYPDPSIAANRARTIRADLAEHVTFRDQLPSWQAQARS